MNTDKTFAFNRCSSVFIRGCIDLLAVKNGSNRRACVSASIPIPVSITSFPEQPPQHLLHVPDHLVQVQRPWRQHPLPAQPSANASTASPIGSSTSSNW